MRFIRLERRQLGRILILLGVACWIPYVLLKHVLGSDVPIGPFLIAHLLGVLSGSVLRHGDWLIGAYRGIKSFKKSEFRMLVSDESVEPPLSKNQDKI